MINGLLIIDKPQGWTSFDVVAKVRGVIARYTKEQGLPRVKVGHTGTLDPMATGVLVLAIGSYTKKIATLSKHDKSYQATVTLGATSNTDDAEGELTVIENKEPSLKEITESLQQFVGTIQQVPPQFSAIKVGGVRSYAAARKGQEVKLAARTVTIYSISDISYAYPDVQFTAHVGSGTYIRSIARDLGERLGTGAYLSALRRTSVGNFNISTACSVDNLDYGTIAKNILAID